MAVSQLIILSDVWAADAIHIPGETMGEIDAMSLLEAQADSLTAFPTLIATSNPLLYVLSFLGAIRLTQRVPPQSIIVFSWMLPL